MELKTGSELENMAEVATETLARVLASKADPLKEAKNQALMRLVPLLFDNNGVALVAIRRIGGGIDGKTIVIGDMPGLDSVKLLLAGVEDAARHMGLDPKFELNLIPAPDTVRQ